jgi:hypothetical protein
MATSPTPDQAPRPEEGPVEQHRNPKGNEAKIDKSLEDTFPASDPPSQSSPGTSVGWEEPLNTRKPKAD